MNAIHVIPSRESLVKPQEPCITCEQMTPLRCEICEEAICDRHSYNGLCKFCDTVREVEQEGAKE